MLLRTDPTPSAPVLRSQIWQFRCQQYRCQYRCQVPDIQRCQVPTYNGARYYTYAHETRCQVPHTQGTAHARYRTCSGVRYCTCAHETRCQVLHKVLHMQWCQVPWCQVPYKYSHIQPPLRKLLDRETMNLQVSLPVVMQTIDRFKTCRL